jgi:hypothetical protein
MPRKNIRTQPPASISKLEMGDETKWQEISFFKVRKKKREETRNEPASLIEMCLSIQPCEGYDFYQIGGRSRDLLLKRNARMWQNLRKDLSDHTINIKQMF